MGTIRKTIFWIILIILGGILVFSSLSFIMAWSLYSWFFQTIRTAGVPDTLNGAISIWLVVFTVALIPTVFSLIFWRKSLKKVAIVAGAVSAWLLISYFISLPGAGQYFNPVTGQAVYRYARTPAGKIELFPLGYNFHPKYRTRLELVTPEIVKELDNQKIENGKKDIPKAEKERQEINELNTKLLALEVQKAHQLVKQEDQKKEQEGQAQEEEQKQPVQEQEQPEQNKIPAPATGLTIREIFGSPSKSNTSLVIKPMYPAWMRKVLRPDLEGIGPAEFDSTNLKIWFYPGQTHGYVRGYVVYEYLKENGMLKDCLNLQDLREIQSRGIVYFRRLFNNKRISLCAWKSVIESNDGFLYVPHLTELKNNDLSVCWTRLDFFFFEDAPAGILVK